jgi:hypothetical protein
MLENAGVESRATLELHVADLRQLFNAMDPAPFRERELDPNADEYIVDWAGERRSDEQLALLVHVGGDAATPANTSMLQEAVHEHFRQRASSTRHRLRRLLRVGRISLAVGLAFVAITGIAAEYLGGALPRESTSAFITESLVIGAWVALWRPLEIFLYEWWPIRSEARLFDRLGEMDVRLLDAGPPAPAPAPASPR